MRQSRNVNPKTELNRRGFLSRVMGVTASLLLSAGTKAQSKPSNEGSLTFQTVAQIQTERFRLPPFDTTGKHPLEAMLQQRRSRRKFSDELLPIGQLSQLLWAAQGVTGEDFGIQLRAAPSAGALYPVDVYVALPTGVYRYQPLAHQLIRALEGDKRMDLAIAALGQEFIAAASMDVVITAEYERSMVKYQQRGVRYSVIEVGHVSQNIYLQAEALGLATVAVGAFNDEEVQRVLKLPKRHRPLIIMPIGYALPL